MSTLAQLRARVQNRLGDISGIDTSSADVDSFLNEAYRRVWTATPFWPFVEAATTTLTVTPPANSVALPTDVESVRAVFSSTDQILLEEIKGTLPYWLFPDRASASGTPQFYRLYAGQLELWPYPSVATSLIVEHPAIPATLAAADSPAFPERYHHILIDWATGQALLDQGDVKADRYLTQFEDALLRMKTDLLSVRGDTYPSINETFWS